VKCCHIKVHFCNSFAQVDELQKCKNENVRLQSENASLEKELEALKEKMSELAAENHNLKDDLNRLPGMEEFEHLKEHMTLLIHENKNLRTEVGLQKRKDLIDACTCRRFSTCSNKMQEGIMKGEKIVFSGIGRRTKKNCNCDRGIVRRPLQKWSNNLLLDFQAERARSASEEQIK